MQILKKLTKRNENKFHLPYLQIKDVQRIILKLKSSNSRGHDEITSRIIKKIYKEISPVLCHLYNNMIRTSYFPQIFKLSRITPLRKGSKNLLLIDSFRHVNNLFFLEKNI